MIEMQERSGRAETVGAELAGLGARIHSLRGQQEWTLEDLAARSGLSKSYLSRIEEGDRQPSIAALLSLAQAFGVSLAGLFPEERTENNCAIVRRGAEQQRAGNGLFYTPLSDRSAPSEMQPIRVTVPADRSGEELYCHDGEEWLYVLKGRLRLILEHESYDLAAGDSAHFDARIPHRLAGLGGRDTELILVACAAAKQLLRSYL
jgi:transcriptional regulator with XRE-family HTH domain